MTRKADDYLALLYQLIITPDDEGGYGVEVAELPGCVTYAQRWADIPVLVQEAMASENDPGA